MLRSVALQSWMLSAGPAARGESVSCSCQNLTLVVPLLVPRLQMDEDKREQFALDEVAADIKAVAEKLKDVEAQIEQARAARDKDEVAALRKEKEQLRTKEEQLRAKELLLFQRQPGALKRLRHRYADSSCTRTFALTLRLACAVASNLAPVPEGRVLESIAALTEVVTRLVHGLEPFIAEERRKRLLRLDPWRSGNRSVQEQAEFKAALLGFYTCDAEPEAPTKPMAKCMVSGKVFPRPVVIASHVWKFSTGGAGIDEFGLRVSDLNSPRNGLLLASEIEVAFDTKRVSFSFDSLTDSFTFHVLDSTLLDKKILNLTDKKTSQSISGYARLDPESIPTFKNLDNEKMTWTAYPFRRLLAWHYAVATLHATRFSWYNAKIPHPASIIGHPDWIKHSPDATWPSRDMLDLFDHAVSKSERDAAEKAEQAEQAEQHAAAASDDEAASST